jgi:hypothetical protein
MAKTAVADKAIVLHAPEKPPGFFSRLWRGIRNFFGLPEKTKIGRHALAVDSAHWDEWVPMTQKEALALLTRDLPKNTSVYLKILGNGTGTIALKARGQFANERSFDLGAKEWDQGTTRVNNQSHGYGRTILRNEMEFFHACGVRKFEIHAGWESGGYTWARLGFLPRIRLDGFKDYTRDEIKKRFEAVKSLLPKAECDKLKNAVGVRRAKDLWYLADRRTDIGPRLKEVFTTARDKPENAQTAKKLDDAFSSGELADYATKQFGQIKDLAAKGKPVPLGRFLLGATDWVGTINTADREQMQRVGKYVGGWTRSGMLPGKRHCGMKPG